MTSITIYGAGSIGNHIAYAARRKDWDVLVVDIDPEALKRMRNQIYPTRYGTWDSEIILKSADEHLEEPADVVFIGTPPDSHVDLARNHLDRDNPPRVLIVEKPLCGPELDGCAELWEKANNLGTFVGVGYNHVLGQNTKVLEDVIKDDTKGTIETLSAKTREHWGGIFAAHPWLSGPEDSYLGFSAKGGGACCEHSHALNMWQHLAHQLSAGRISEVSALLDMRQAGKAYYDQLAILSVVTEKGLAGEVIQDVVTFPTEKMARIQWSNGFAEWHVGYRLGVDAVVHGDSSGEPVKTLIEKTRADDFGMEFEHIEDIVAGNVRESPISLARGLDTMMVIAAAFKSATEKRAIQIDWSVGYRPEALK